MRQTFRRQQTRRCQQRTKARKNARVKYFFPTEVPFGDNGPYPKTHPKIMVSNRERYDNASIVTNQFVFTKKIMTYSECFVLLCLVIFSYPSVIHCFVFILLPSLGLCVISGWD